MLDEMSYGGEVIWVEVIMGAKKFYCQQNLRKFSEVIKLGETGLQHEREWGFFNLSDQVPLIRI